MKLSKIIVFISFLFLVKNTSCHTLPLVSASYDLCPGVTCTTSSGIKVSAFASEETYYVNTIDSINFWVGLTSAVCAISPPSVSFNYSPLSYTPSFQNYNYGYQFRLMGVPGRYGFEIWVGNAPQYFSFILALNPVGIKVLENKEGQISVYPNPANKEVTVSYQNENIKNIQIYSSEGKLFGNFKPDNFSTTIPLKDFPPGIYFVNVILPSNKIIVRKISVQ